MSQNRGNWPFVGNFVANFVDEWLQCWDFDKAVSDEVSDKVFPKTLLGQALPRRAVEVYSNGLWATEGEVALETLPEDQNVRG